MAFDITQLFDEEFVFEFVDNPPTPVLLLLLLLFPVAESSSLLLFIWILARLFELIGDIWFRSLVALWWDWWLLLLFGIWIFMDELGVDVLLLGAVVLEELVVLFEFEEEFVFVVLLVAF